MLHDEVESILGSIAGDDDWGPFEAKLRAIAEMAEAYGTGVAAASRT